MPAKIVYGWARGGCLLASLIIQNIGPAAFAGEIKAATIPLVQVTSDRLTSLRAVSPVREAASQAVQTGNAINIIDPDGLCDQISAMETLSKAFKVPYCFECVSPALSPRFSFSVEANERLVDALDKLNKNSSGFFQWRLLHGRLVVSAQVSDDKDGAVMDRRVSVQVEAETLQAALEQVEASYNKEYSDVPLVILPASPRLALKGRPTASGKDGAFQLKQEGSLREIFLAVLDQMQDPAVCYDFAEVIGPKGCRFFELHATKEDQPDLDQYADTNEAMLHASMSQDFTRRLEGYLSSRKEETGTPAAE